MSFTIFLLAVLMIDCICMMGIAVYVKLFPLDFCKDLVKYRVSSFFQLTAIFAFLLQVVGVARIYSKSEAVKRIYIIYYTLTMVTFISWAILASILYIRFDSHLNDCLKKKLDPYTFGRYNFLYVTQRKNSCCGINGVGDWRRSPPSSCCPNEESKCKNPYTRGCREAFYSSTKSIQITTVVTASFMVFLQPVVTVCLFGSFH
ncbi:23 kDa integral membrane protein [Thelohanellus kitauei]|uniref:23 kDa integral membrane protein n=1 Tax=Thelohanellus kitauei TaxID=669202 RepID=A0A0C2MMG9_THEKT|nr:23 kDa integral membrane protein [Thelohanellus kitauei]